MLIAEAQLFTSQATKVLPSGSMAIAHTGKPDGLGKGIQQASHCTFLNRLLGRGRTAKGKKPIMWTVGQTLRPSLGLKTIIFFSSVLEEFRKADFGRSS